MNITETRSPLDPQTVCRLGRSVLETEQQAIAQLAERIDDNFVTACQTLLNCQGHIIVIGMGKSGHIGNKIAATLASTGSPAFFIHPGEASHGDLGMITPGDVVLGLSYSGKTQELLTLLPLLQRRSIPLLAISGDPCSPLAQVALVHLNVQVNQEACPLGLAPTASTTAMLAMGDALAMSLLELRGFSSKDFAMTHPAGSLGMKLLLQVDQLMSTGDLIPQVDQHTKISETLLEMTRKCLGMTIVTDEQQQICGIYTDGDLRRTLNQSIDLEQQIVKAVMTQQFRSVTPSTLAIEALAIMHQHKITALVVTEDQKTCLGILHLHHLLKAGLT